MKEEFRKIYGALRRSYNGGFGRHPSGRGPRMNNWLGGTAAVRKTLGRHYRRGGSSLAAEAAMCAMGARGLYLPNL